MAALQAHVARSVGAPAAVKELEGGADDAMLPLVKKALAAETDPGIKANRCCSWSPSSS